MRCPHPGLPRHGGGEPCGGISCFGFDWDSFALLLAVCMGRLPALSGCSVCLAGACRCFPSRAACCPFPRWQGRPGRAASFLPATGFRPAPPASSPSCTYAAGCPHARSRGFSFYASCPVNSLAFASMAAASAVLSCWFSVMMRTNVLPATTASTDGASAFACLPFEIPNPP